MQGQPRAVQMLSGQPNKDPSPSKTTTSSFTADNKIQEMENDIYKNTFTYGPSGERFKVNHYQDDVLTSSKLYVGNSEFVLDASGNIDTSRTFIYAPTGICAVYEKDAQNNAAMNYIYTDYLGSWLKITNAAGTVTERYSYDAWGRPRDPDTWQLKPIDITDALANLNAMQPRFDRGYTGHEHMAGFGLINMNGRLYDPYLQRFLSPDNFVQSPGNAQNYNRFTYCMNNPLMYTDPTGWYDTPWDPSAATSREDGASQGGELGYSMGANYLDNPGFSDDVWKMIQYSWDKGEGTYSGEELRENALIKEYSFSITIPGGIFYTIAHFTGIGEAIESSGGCGAMQLTFRWTENYNPNFDFQITGEQQNWIENNLSNEIEYLEFSGNRSPNRNRVDGTLTWYKEDGFGKKTIVETWSAVSGSRSLRPIPQGEWALSNYRLRNNQGFVRNGVGFSVNITPDPRWGRSRLRIHPDGWPDGTAGCIGLTGDASSLLLFSKMISSYLLINKTMRLVVDYNIPIIQLYP